MLANAHPTAKLQLLNHPFDAQPHIDIHRGATTTAVSTRLQTIGMPLRRDHASRGAGAVHDFGKPNPTGRILGNWHP
eukprot:11167013-Lingulodinium_polyedra.AAC.1